MSLRSARQKKGMSIAKASRELGVSRQTLYAWENGTWKPAMNHIVSLSELYGVSAVDLMKGLLSEYKRKSL